MNWLPHGFKADSERLALEVRGELGLDAEARLDPWALADLYGVPVCALGELEAHGAPAAAVARLRGEEAGQQARQDAALSALTVFCGARRQIVVNDAHPRARQVSSLAHELAHLLLEHAPAPPAEHLTAGRWSRVMEREADWLGGALLVPERAAYRAALTWRSDREVAARYGVSEQLARWRLNETGARRVAARTRRAG